MVIVENKLETSTLYFRFCQKINKCTNIDTETFAVIINNEGKSNEECIPLVYTDQYFADNFELINSENPNDGVTATFTKQKFYFHNSSHNNFGIKYILECSENDENLEIVEYKYAEDT